MATATAKKTIEDLVEEGLVETRAYKQYGSDTKLVVYNGYGSDDENIAIVGAYCEANGYEWCYDDSVLIDYDMMVAYTDSADVIGVDGEALGRLGFEDGTYDFSCLEDTYIDNPSVALPSWYDDKELEDLGFEKISCEFDSGLYEHNKNQDPKEIAENIRSLRPNAKKEIIFKIDFVSQFEMGYCVFVRSDDIED